MQGRAGRDRFGTQRARLTYGRTIFHLRSAKQRAQRRFANIRVRTNERRPVLSSARRSPPPSPRVPLQEELPSQASERRIHGSFSVERQLGSNVHN